MRAAVLVGVLVAILGACATRREAPVLTLAWTDNSGGTASTRIERRTDPGSYAPVGSVAPGVVAWTDTTVLAGTRYCYRVAAVAGGVTSPYSNEDCATTAAAPPDPQPPADPVRLTVFVSRDGSVTVTPPNTTCPANG